MLKFLSQNNAKRNLKLLFIVHILMPYYHKFTKYRLRTITKTTIQLRETTNTYKKFLAVK